MTIKIDIPEQAVPAFNAYLATQVTAELDAFTKKGKTTPHFADIQDFIQKQADSVVAYVTANFSK